MFLFYCENKKRDWPMAAAIPFTVPLSAFLPQTGVALTTTDVQNALQAQQATNQAISTTQQLTGQTVTAITFAQAQQINQSAPDPTQLASQGTSFQTQE